MHAGHADVALTPLADRPGNGVERRPQIEDADTNPEDIDAFMGHLKFCEG